MVDRELRGGEAVLRRGGEEALKWIQFKKTRKPTLTKWGIEYSYYMYIYRKEGRISPLVKAQRGRDTFIVNSLKTAKQRYP